MCESCDDFLSGREDGDFCQECEECWGECFNCGSRFLGIDCPHCAG